MSLSKAAARPGGISVERDGVPSVFTLTFAQRRRLHPETSDSSLAGKSRVWELKK